MALDGPARKGLARPAARCPRSFPAPDGEGRRTGPSCPRGPSPPGRGCSTLTSRNGGKCKSFWRTCELLSMNGSNQMATTLAGTCSPRMVSGWHTPICTWCRDGQMSHTRARESGGGSGSRTLTNTSPRCGRLGLRSHFTDMIAITLPVWSTSCAVRFIWQLVCSGG